MDLMLEMISRFPTALYTVPLIVCLVFWLLTLLGLFDMEIFDLDVDGADSLGGLSGLLATFGLSDVPLTLALSILFFIAWVICLVSGVWLQPVLPEGNISLWINGAVLGISFIVSVFLTGRIVRFLDPFFVTHEARSKHSLIAQACEITSMSVDKDFGQAKLEDGGAGLIISVRALEPNTLTKGHKAMIYDYDADKNIYFISTQQ